MSTYGGNPAISQSALPSAKNIASTSNTTPIVVTTSAAHGIRTGAYVRVSGATDTSANGDWLAGAVTSTTVTLTVIPGGGNSTTGGGGGAAGTIQDLGFGVVATLPNDATDDMDAGSVNVPFEEVLDRTEYLQYSTSWTKRSLGFGLEVVPNNTWLIGGNTIAAGNIGLSTITAGNFAFMMLNLPHGAIVRTFKVRLVPAAHVSLPGQMPKLTYFKVSIDGVTDPNTLSGAWTATDTTGSAASYSNPHDLVLDLGANDTIDRTGYVYYMKITQESGSNSADGDVGQPRILLS